MSSVKETIPMDCRNALEMLEVLRPDSHDAMAADVAAAVAHVEACPSCRSTAASRRSLDRRIARVMRDVPIPTGLKERLLSTAASAAADDFGANQLDTEASETDFAEAEQAVVEQRSAHAGAARQSRRMWMQATLATTATCLCMGVALWRFGYLQSSQMTLEDFRATATLDVAGLDEFDGSFPVQRPGFGWRSSRRVVVATPALGYSPNEGSRHEVAVFEFQFTAHGGRTVRGALLAIPAAQIADPPRAGAFIPGNVQYISTEAGPFPTVAWTEGDLVYLCIVPENAAGRLDDLQRELRRSGLT